MLKGVSSRVLLIPAAPISQLLVLACLRVSLRAGTRYLDNENLLPITPGLYLVLISLEE